MRFEYECPHCGFDKIYGTFGDNVYCPKCDITFETDCDVNCTKDEDESWGAWLTGVEHRGKVDLEDNYYYTNPEE